jgi:arylsulfatase A-like enzyme
MQGRDISDLYLDRTGLAENPWRDEFYYEFPIDYFPNCSALVRKKWKYMHWPTHKYEQLFDLENDPFELHDLGNTSEVGDILKEMRARHIELYNKIAESESNTTKPICKKGSYP